MFIPLKDENPTAKFPLVTIFLISLNGLIFLIQLVSPHGLQYTVLQMGAIPYEITHWHTLQGLPVSRVSPILALFVSMFLHGGMFHLLGNMLYLWIFGNNVEDYLGPIKFILFYLICGLSASLTHIIFNPNSTVPMIGASGAIAGILGAYFILYPMARVMTLVFIWIVPLPAAFILGLWLLMQILNLGLGGGVAWFAHIGGFLVGIGLVRVFAKRKRAVAFH
jgi:membrane associated rhomboid family serine protease